jgi:protein-S-isoprenylcysteine O-methyltransferase Ste14
MTAELSLYGLYVPTLLLLAVLALICTRALGRLLMHLGFYRLVWHPALFEFALFVILLGGFSTFLTTRGI